MRSIVIGTDGSPSAEAAVRRGAEVARGSGAGVHLVCAYPDIPSEELGAERIVVDLAPLNGGTPHGSA